MSLQPLRWASTKSKDKLSGDFPYKGLLLGIIRRFLVFFFDWGGNRIVKHVSTLSAAKEEYSIPAKDYVYGWGIVVEFFSTLRANRVHAMYGSFFDWGIRVEPKTSGLQSLHSF